MIRIKNNFLPLILLLLVILIISSVVVIPARYILIKIIQIPVRLIHSLFNQIRLVMTLRAISFDMQDYEALKKDHRILQYKYDEVSAENERLKKILSFKEKGKRRFIAARIIFADASNWSWGFIINKGKNYGISKDDPVVTAEGLVGKILDVWKDTAHVMLLNDPNFAVAAMLKTTREKGLIVGSLDGSCKMIYVSDIADIGKDEEILTAGTNSVFPKGIPIGKVISVEKDYTGSPYFVIQPYVKVNQIEEVLVLK